MRILFALALLPFAAFSNPLETDFDQIYIDNADAVVEKNGGQSVELANKVLLSRNAEGKYLALDGSPHLAVGCVLRITLQSTAVAQLCPGILPENKTAQLQANVQSIAEFYAANNVPSRPVEDVQGALDEAISALMERLKNLNCEGPEASEFQAFVATFVNEDAQEKLVKSLATPRLPVTQPCL